MSAALDHAYGGRAGTVDLAPGDPARAVHVYRAEDRWHLVTEGVAGGELSVLTPAGADGAQPPGWAVALLLGAAATAAAVGRPLHAGARLAPGPPLDGARTGLVALGVREDPVDPEVRQLVGVTRGEHALMGRTSTALVLARLAERDPLLRTDPARA